MERKVVTIIIRIFENTARSRNDVYPDQRFSCVLVCFAKRSSLCSSFRWIEYWLLNEIALTNVRKKIWASSARISQANWSQLSSAYFLCLSWKEVTSGMGNNEPVWSLSILVRGNAKRASPPRGGFNNVFLSLQISFLPRSSLTYQCNRLFRTLSCSDILCFPSPDEEWTSRTKMKKKKEK